MAQGVNIEVDVARVLQEELARARATIISNMEAAGQRATGRTADSMSVAVEGEGVHYTGLLTARPFFGALETGSRPWSKQYTRKTKDGREVPSPPKFFVDIIDEWATAKGLALSPYLVARKIMTDGSKLYRDGGRTDIFTPVVDTTFKAVAERLFVMFDHTITTSILDTIKQYRK